MNFPHILPKLQVLDEAGIKKFYFTAVEVLERTGVSVPHKESCDLLKDAGAWVKEILSGPRPTYLDQRQAQALSGIIKRRTETMDK